jgi:hypothetical protein
VAIADWANVKAQYQASRQVTNLWPVRLLRGAFGSLKCSFTTLLAKNGNNGFLVGSKLPSWL